MSGSPHDAHRIAGYLGSMSTFAALWATTHRAVSRGGRDWPTGWSLKDVALGAVATHKLSRIISKEGVTTPLRAPFTEFDEAAGSSEHHDHARGHGVRHTIGELLTCPFCLGVWIGTAYVAGLVVAPRATRAWAAVFSVVAGSDLLQQTYQRVRVDQ